MRKLIGALMLALLCGPLEAADWTFKVKHLRTPLARDHPGTLVIGADNIQYQQEGEKEPLRWDFGEIQQLKLEPAQVEILTYKEQKWKFGKDALFRFQLLDGSVDAELSRFLRRKITGVFVTAIVPESYQNPAYTAPVRHRLIGRDSEGVLEVYADRIVYRAESKQKSRSWTYEQIESFAFPSRREFELVTDEKKLGGPTRTFRFQLKQPLPESIYDYLWVRVHGSSYYPYEKPPANDRPSVTPPPGNPSVAGAL